MPNASAVLHGVYPVLATPFGDDGSVDHAGLGRLVDFIAGAGADGIVFPGVASEFESLESAERRRLVEFVARRVNGRIPFVAGVSAADADAAVALAQHARDAGAAALMAVAPASFKGNAAGIADYYRRIATVGVPIILQNAPPPAGCALSPAEVTDLARANAAIRYVKEEAAPCGQRITQILAARVPTLDGVFGGAGGRYITDELARGACGTMPACELTDLHARQFALHRAGDAAGVRRLFDRMLPLLNFQAVFRMAMTKEVLRRRGILASTHVRAAGPRLDAGDMIELDAILAGLTDLVPDLAAPRAAQGRMEHALHSPCPAPSATQAAKSVPRRPPPQEKS